MGEIVDFRSGGTPSKKQEKYWGGSVPWLSAKDMKSFRIYDTQDHVTELGAQNGTREVKKGTVLLLTRGMTLLNDVPICVAMRPLTFNQDVKALTARGGLCPEFLPYLLLAKKRDLLGLVDLAGHGTGRINTDELKGLDVSLPPVSKQQSIAQIFRTLDDKIELNRRMNETLEEMARALFKSWFVDFDPVRAKMEGRWRRGESLPGLPADLYDLFPDRLVPSELGDIPEEWIVGSFGDLIEQRSERVGGRGVTVLSAVAKGELEKSDDLFSKRVYSKNLDKYLLVEQWDFAFNPSRINIGSIGMLKEDFFGGVSPVYVVFRPLSKFRWFLEFSLKATNTKTWIATLCSGSVRQSLSFSDFASIPTVIPPEGLVDFFNEIWEMNLSSIDIRKSEAETLSELRDSLLPKLIAGNV
ncbi:MAG: restriction endonuclease subunit S [Acidobacteriota bacterium]|nr:MAG: restriction endonuclease subunit S [Acidobacteriota bacterium]